MRPIPGKELFANQANLRYKNKISSVFMTIILRYNEKSPLTAAVDLAGEQGIKLVPDHCGGQQDNCKISSERPPGPQEGK